MDIQKKPEFTETINLVKAVLERLEFHAFEEVLIWSEEHASKALLRCLKKTLSEFENGHLVLTSSYPKLKHFSIDTVTSGLMTALDQAQERQDNLNREIDELKDQLAKAQAVPEWISVEDKLPETEPNTDGVVCAVVCSVGNVYRARYMHDVDVGVDTKYWSEFSVGYNGVEHEHYEINAKITHWMPLPDAPQEPTND